MSNKILIIFIAGLLFSVLGLGFAIYKKGSSRGSSDILSENRLGNSNPERQSDFSVPTDTSINSLLPSAGELGITEDERAALAHPANEASIEEKKSHFELIQKVAKETSVLDITKCKTADPVVLKIKFGESILVENKDDVPHSIVFNAENAYDIPANSTKEIKPAFSYGAGTYGYGCDQVPHAVGLFLVTD